MPRIRKQTSNRLKTHDREKVKKKVKETRRKKQKLAKKNPQWKSKKPKDPGIPNDFPYKDQILAEVQEQRRVVAEEKERKKEEKSKAIARAKAIALGAAFEDGSEDGSQEEGTSGDEPVTMSRSLDVGADGIASLSAKTLNKTLKPRPQPPVMPSEEEEEEDVPVLLNRDLSNFGAVFDKADVILEVLDARDPLAFHSKHIEDLAETTGKKILLVLNKIDRCPREALAAWTAHLRIRHPTCLFRAATAFLPDEQTLQPSSQAKSNKGKAKAPVDDAIGAATILSFLSQCAKELRKGRMLKVAVIGVANVGKSSLVNSVLKKSALSTYTLASASQSAATTEIPQEVTLGVEGQTIVFIDTPGLTFVSKPEEEVSSVNHTRVQDILLRSRGRIDRLKDPVPPISQILSRASNEDLMLLYSLAAFTKDDPSAFLAGVARAHQMVKKKGELDLAGAARIVLRDWNTGKFAHYSTPTGLPSTELHSDDTSILDSHPARRDMRKSCGLVKMSAGAVEERTVDLVSIWIAADDSEDEDSDNMDVLDDNKSIDQEDIGDDENVLSQSSDMDNEGVEENDVIPEVVPVSRKQKRKRETEFLGSVAPKKVSLGRATVFEAKGKNDLPKVLWSETRPKETAGPKSILKKVGAAMNKAGSKKPPHTTPLSAAGKNTEPEAYDFGKFF